jgi:hypothetical protein
LPTDKRKSLAEMQDFFHLKPLQTGLHKAVNEKILWRSQKTFVISTWGELGKNAVNPHCPPR